MSDNNEYQNLKTKINELCSMINHNGTNQQLKPLPEKNIKEETKEETK